MWTKSQLIQKAFGELALAGYVYDLDADQLEDALSTLDSMMAEWTTYGISIGYALPATPDDSNIDDDSGIPGASNRAVFLNLAVALAAGRGKALTAQTLGSAARAYQQLLGAAARAAAVRQPLPNTMPQGAGNKPWRTGYGDRFFPGPCESSDCTTPPTTP